MKTRAIDIDIDVHKAIEAARKDFSEPDNSVLRRLLGIDATSQLSLRSVERKRPWIGKGHSRGLNLPHGTELRLHYNATNLNGIVEDGALVFEGKAYGSPSGVARELCRTKKGDKTHLNGKSIIEARLPGEANWVGLTLLQKRILKEAKAAAAA